MEEYTWDLTLPRQLVQCFYYLLALRRRLHAEVQEDLNTFDIKKMVTEESKKFRANWRYSPNQLRKKDGKDGESASKILVRSMKSLMTPRSIPHRILVVANNNTAQFIVCIFLAFIILFVFLSVYPYYSRVVYFM